MFDQVLHRLAGIFGKLPCNPVGHDGTKAQAVVAQCLTQPVNSRSFHFEICDPVIAEPEAGKVIHQPRICQAQSQHPSLWTVKARTGDGNALVVILRKMFQQEAAAHYQVG